MSALLLNEVGRAVLSVTVYVCLCAVFGVCLFVCQPSVPSASMCVCVRV